MVSFAASRRAIIDYPHIIEFDKTFIVPLAGANSLDITKLLEFSTNFVVIDRLTGCRVSQRYNQSTLKTLGQRVILDST